MIWTNILNAYAQYFKQFQLKGVLMNSKLFGISVRALTLVALTSIPTLHAIQNDETYTVQKAKEANAILGDFLAKMNAFATTVDKDQIAKDKATHGEPDETKVRFLMLQLPAMRAMKALGALGYTFTVQTGTFTATDVVPAVIDRETNTCKGFVIIKRLDGKPGEEKETYATMGGFHEYGLTYAENGSKEAAEETKVKVPVSTMHFAGLFDDPKRDARQHVASMAYTGATYDMPQQTAEARQVILIKDESELPQGPWFASDHRAIALACIRAYQANEVAILAALKTSEPTK